MLELPNLEPPSPEPRSPEPPSRNTLSPEPRSPEPRSSNCAARNRAAEPPARSRRGWRCRAASRRHASRQPPNATGCARAALPVCGCRGLGPARPSLSRGRAGRPAAAGPRRPPIAPGPLSRSDSRQPRRSPRPLRIAPWFAPGTGARAPAGRPAGPPAARARQAQRRRDRVQHERAQQHVVATAAGSTFLMAGQVTRGSLSMTPSRAGEGLAADGGGGRDDDLE